MPENEIILSDDAPETAKEKFERERLTRRQALKKFGMTSAMATFALFSVDDLARMVGRAMQQRAGDNKVAAQVAKELQQAGVAMADPSPLPAGHCNAFQNSLTQSDCLSCNEDRYERCISTCATMQGDCWSAYMQGNYTCGHNPLTYNNLQLDWAPVCAFCLANCN